MPVSYEPLNVNTDVTTTKTILHEVIPLTGAVVSGTYNDENIKNFVHGMFQSVYDYPYLSSSANHVFDLSCGYDESSALSASVNAMNTKKINMYNQFSQVLLGYTGSNNVVRLFENDLTLDSTGSMKNCFFLSFARLITKDQIKKGTFSITLGRGKANPAGGALAATSLPVVLADIKASATGEGTTNTVGGDYGVLYDITASTSNSLNTSSHGVIFYQAGIMVLSSSVFDENNPASAIGLSASALGAYFNSSSAISASNDRTPLKAGASLATASISGNVDALRSRIKNITFNNSTEINSTIYFCRLPVNKFNYSANPT